MALGHPAPAVALAPQSPAATDPARRLALVRRLALWCAGLMLATIVLSAFMRLSSAGLGCADWPACYGQGLRDAVSGQAPPGSHAVALARVTHRIVASLVLVLVIVLTMATLGTRPLLPREGRLALALLLLALALAALGVVTAGATLPAVTLGNLVGGFVMLALCWRLAMAPARPGDPPGLGLSAGLAWLALLLLLAQVTLGALVSGSYAALSCDSWADCGRAAAAGGWDWRALNPWQQPALGDGLPVNPAGALTQLAHRVGALLLLPALAALGLAAWRRGRRRTALALVLLVALQALLGWAAVGSGLPIVLVLLHNLNAALLLALLARQV